MAYQINFWQFSKKRNSTERPVPAYMKAQVYCNLMGGSGILNPVFKLAPDDLTLIEDNVTVLNYAQVPEFNRYYYVTDWKYDNGLWYVTMVVDVLASQKNYIGALTTYILRSASNFDSYLTDNMYPAKVGATTSSSQDIANPFNATFDNGYFVVGIINNDVNAYGAVSYYVFTSMGFRQFANNLLGSFSVYSADEISDQLGKLLFNPFQYIVSCVWFPVSVTTQGSQLSTVKIGWWTLSAQCYRLHPQARVQGSGTIVIPKHPQSLTRPYLNGSPYSDYYLTFPPFGSFSISANIIAKESVLDYSWYVDAITGDATLRIGDDWYNVVHGQVGVPIQLAQMTPNISGAIQQMIPSTGNQTADTIISTLGSIGNAIIAKQMPMQTTGRSGGFLTFNQPINLTGIFYTVADEEVTEFGAPCCKTLTIDDLSGYVLCAHGDFIGNCTATETEEINNYLTSGFFYE